jgi:hypothetical protein
MQDRYSLLVCFCLLTYSILDTSLTQFPSQCWRPQTEGPTLSSWPLPTYCLVVLEVGGGGGRGEGHGASSDLMQEPSLWFNPTILSSCIPLLGSQSQWPFPGPPGHDSNISFQDQQQTRDVNPVILVTLTVHIFNSETIIIIYYESCYCVLICDFQIFFLRFNPLIMFLFDFYFYFDFESVYGSQFFDAKLLQILRK